MNVGGSTTEVPCQQVWGW